MKAVAASEAEIKEIVRKDGVGRRCDYFVQRELLNLGFHEWNDNLFLA